MPPSLTPIPIPPGTPADPALDAFLAYLEEKKISLYDHQEEAILELYAGKNVILNTPTGSGKTMVALALQHRALSTGRRAYYTVPIKALANEKFLDLCATFGAEHVGMITGDATVNASAPLICCTAEILSNLALREGENTPVDDIIIDEFHYYSDHDRGTAWEVPLLTLRKSRFLLMSATLGETTFFKETLTSLTGTPTALVRSTDRPVPLHFQYSEIPLEEKVGELVEEDNAPIYLVHFTQMACAKTAQNLLSTNLCSKEEKREITEALQDADFRSPYGKDISKLIRHGIGIHHAGLLPKYRLLIEKLAARGLLKVICGTDTLGVGVNVPIRTVLFTRLCKFDGRGTRILTVRDFQQISGRAGRRGFDTEGHVVAQAPEHVIENLKLEAKAAAKPGKSKIVKKKPPEKGYIAWDENTFQRLISSQPETLNSAFSISHGMLLSMLSRPDEDGCAALRNLIAKCHLPEAKKPPLRRHAFKLFKGLVRGEILKIIPINERRTAAKVEIGATMQEEFSMHQALGLYLLDTIPKLDAESPSYPLDLISLVEAILEDPIQILRRQVDTIKDELAASLKRDGVGFEERMEKLEAVEHPKPGKDFIYNTFNAFIPNHPYLDERNIKVKSIAREMVENYQSFEDYIKTYGLQRSEALLLRHLSEVYKVLAHTVPPAAKTEELLEAESFIEDLVRNTDSTLLDEWEQLKNPDAPIEKRKAHTPKPTRFTADKKAFTKALRHEIFKILKSLATWDTTAALTHLAPNSPDDQPWTPDRLMIDLEEFYTAHEILCLDPAARSADTTRITPDTDAPNKLWHIEQILVSPEGPTNWSLHLEADLPQSDSESHPVLKLISFAPANS